MTMLQFSVFIAVGSFLLHSKSVLSVCVGTSPSTCLVDMDADEANETLKYVLEKYEEVDMKIAGEPFGVHGKRITSGDTEEVHIVFKYGDKTPADVIQNCAFIVTSRPSECQLIRTFCNAFVANTPSPLLRPKSLVLCNGEADGDTQVRVIDEDEELEDDEGLATAAIDGDAERAAFDGDVEILKETTTEMTQTKK